MDFPLRDAINAAFVPAPIEDNNQRQGGSGGQNQQRRGSAGGNMTSIYNVLSHDFVYQDLSHMLLFMSNHDTERIADVFDENPAKVKLAFTVLATMRGIPQMFYGDEFMFAIHKKGRDDGRLRMDVPGGWKEDKINLFTDEGRKAADGEFSNAAEMHDYVRNLFQWRKNKEVIHSGKTMHFIPENNTYGYFRYNDKDIVFVFINNSDKDVKLSWSRFAEMTEGLGEGRDVINNCKVTLSDDTLVKANTAIVVEYTK